jgi:hypothetical protein
MRAPFNRRCSEVTAAGPCLSIVDGSISEAGHESLWCATGHNVKQWYVVDADGDVMAKAKLNSSPEILNEEMLLALRNDPLYCALVYKPPPTHPCKRGHSDWYMNPDESYRCRQCKKMSYENHKTKCRDRYRATPAYKLNQLARQAQMKEKKNVRNKA